MVNMKSPEERYAELAAALLKRPGVVQPVGKKGFGSSGLYTGGKLFAFLSYGKRLVVKLPGERVDELVADGEGTRFDPRGKGRALREWFVLAPRSRKKWLFLVEEARDFVATLTAR